MTIDSYRASKSTIHSFLSFLSVVFCACRGMRWSSGWSFLTISTQLRMETEVVWSEKNAGQCKATTTRGADQVLLEPHIHGIFGVTLPEIHNDFQDVYV